jgi:1-acyl-sn-glycerol-3-phosphate acyltransferase
LQQNHFLTRYYRISRILIHTIVGLTLAALVLPIISKSSNLKLIKWWCGGLLRAFNIKVVQHGQPPPANTSRVMFVANHISWSDIHALNSVIPLRFIAKSDIKSWPIFGYLVRKSNTIFVERGKRQEAGRIVALTKDSLSAGDNVCFFPEGTTTDGNGAGGYGINGVNKADNTNSLRGTPVLAFKSSVLQAAIDAKATIWPVAIRYAHADGSINTQMAYAGDTTLIESMQNVLKQKNPTVNLHFLTPIQTDGQNRRDLTKAAYDVIVAKLLSLA